MIDLSNIQFHYTKEEVDTYCKDKKCSLEELLQILINTIKVKARVPVSHFQVGAAAYTESGDIFLGTNMEMAFASINHTVHAEQCTITNVFLHSKKTNNEKILILAVSETPCGHCRQILQELPDAKHIRIIVPRLKIDSPLEALLPYSFELPVNNIVHHVFESSTLLSEKQVDDILFQPLRSIQETYQLTEKEFSLLQKRSSSLLLRSFSWYSNCPAVAIFISKQKKFAIGSMIESSAYNPTINPLQMALIDCHVQDIAYDDLIELILIEKKECCCCYKGFLDVLSKCLSKQTTMKESSPIQTMYYTYYIVF